jgi:hypothetical protein
LCNGIFGPVFGGLVAYSLAQRSGRALPSALAPFFIYLYLAFLDKQIAGLPFPVNFGGG